MIDTRPPLPPNPQQARFAWRRLCWVVPVFTLLGIGFLSSGLALSGFSLGRITILVACGIAMAPCLLYQQLGTKPVKRH